MGSGYVVMPSSIGAKLLSSSRPTVPTGSVVDLATYVDVTGYESVLVVLVSAKLGSEAVTPETGTSITLTALHSAASDGTGATNCVDRAGNNLSTQILGSAATGRGTSMQIRTRGLKQYFSPGLTAGVAAVTCCVSVYGLGVRDTLETSAHWNDEAGAVLAPGTYS